MSSLKSKVINSWKWTFSVNSIGMVASLLISITNYRLLSPSDYGLFALCSSVMFFFRMLQDFSLETTLIQKKEINGKVLGTSFWFLIIYSIFLFSIAYLSSLVLAHVYEQPILINLVVISSIGFFSNSLTLVPRVQLKREFKFKQVSLATTSIQIMSGLTVMLFAYMGHGVWSLLYGGLFNNFASTIIFYLLTKWSVPFYFSKDTLKELLNFGVLISGRKAISQVRNSFLPMIIGKYFGIETLGIFHFSSNFCKLIIAQTDSMITQVLLPAFSTLQDDKEKLTKAFLKVIEFSVLINFAIISGYLFVGDSLVSVFYGDKWIESASIISILCVATLAEAIGNKSMSLFISDGNPGVVLKWEALFTPLMIILLYLTTSLKFSEFLFSYSLFSLIFHFALVEISWRKYSISKMKWIEILKRPLLSAMLMSAVLYLTSLLNLNIGERLELGINIVLGAAIYSVSSYMAYKKDLKTIYA